MKTVLLVVAMFVCCCSGGSPDPEPGNVCDEANQIVMNGLWNCCSFDGDNCCYCRCMREHGMGSEPGSSPGGACNCVGDLGIPFYNNYMCIGNNRALAALCISDIDACENYAYEFAINKCREEGE